ncbi:MAG TPA: hypothetical protein VHL79_23815 [Ramlibacter sp.]|jgi:hypothetical protein|nr:hypothetical protein [Ramlibacter sp.]
MPDARDEILAECALAFGPNSEDCNKYVKAVSAPFFDPDLFTGPNMNADRIVALLRQSGDWTQLGTSHDQAIASAKAGRFVVAGMTSSELQSSNGHLAIVVGDDGQNSGTVRVPICYAGSLNPAARVQRKRVSETFGAQVARDSKISYFARDVQTLPAAMAVSRLVDELRGVSVPSTEQPLVLASAQVRAASAPASRRAPAKKAAAKTTKKQAGAKPKPAEGTTRKRQPGQGR